MNALIGYMLILSFVGLVYYCLRGYNLMIGFFVMSLIWTILPLIGNYFQPVPLFENQTMMSVLKTVYQQAPERWGAVLVNIFFGAWFGQVLLKTGIASAAIRKSVELGGDNPALILFLVNLITGIIFTSMSGAGPVLAIAVIILPILLSIGIPKAIALFAFTGSVAAGIFLNPINFSQYQTFFATGNQALAYNYSDYVPFGLLAFVVMIAVVSLFSWLYLRKKKPSFAWAVEEEADTESEIPNLALLTPFLPVLGAVLFKLPVILCFILSGLFALIICRQLTNGFAAGCQLLTKLFADGVIETSALVGFWLCLSTFNSSAQFAGPYFQAAIGGLIPTSAFLLVLVFIVLSPLSWFRGPLNLVGCGAAILAVISQGPTEFPVMFLYPLFISVMIGMGHFDITTSWVAWGLGYLKVEAKDYMRMSLIPGVCIVLILEIITFLKFGIGL